MFFKAVLHHNRDLYNKADSSVAVKPFKHPFCNPTPTRVQLVLTIAGSDRILQTVAARSLTIKPLHCGVAIALKTAR